MDVLDNLPADPFRVSAVFDDGGIYTGTLQNLQDARHRYDLFVSHSERRPAFVGLFARSSNNLLVLCRSFGGGEEKIHQDIGS
jgi:hypothetical protein